MGAGLGIKYKCITFTMPYLTWSYAEPYNAPLSAPNRQEFNLSSHDFYVNVDGEKDSNDKLVYRRIS